MRRRTLAGRGVFGQRRHPGMRRRPAAVARWSDRHRSAAARSNGAGLSAVDVAAEDGPRDDIAPRVSIPWRPRRCRRSSSARRAAGRGRPLPALGAPAGDAARVAGLAARGPGRRLLADQGQVRRAARTLALTEREACGRLIGPPVIDRDRKQLAFHAWHPSCPMEDNAHGVPKSKDTRPLEPEPELIRYAGFGDNSVRLGPRRRPPRLHASRAAAAPCHGGHRPCAWRRALEMRYRQPVLTGPGSGRKLSPG